jgi:hypothetical protein
MVVRTPLMTIAAFIALCAMALSVDSPAALQAEAGQQVSEFEGVLKVHPKFLYKYYVTGIAEGQHFALSPDAKFKDIQPGSMIHVEGRLATRFHPGGNDKNPSPFPRGWYVWMDVESVKVLEDAQRRTAAEPPPAASSRESKPQATPDAR